MAVLVTRPEIPSELTLPKKSCWQWLGLGYPFVHPPLPRRLPDPVRDMNRRIDPPSHPNRFTPCRGVLGSVDRRRRTGRCRCPVRVSGSGTGIRQCHGKGRDRGCHWAGPTMTGAGGAEKGGPGARGGSRRGTPLARPHTGEGPEGTVDGREAVVGPVRGRPVTPPRATQTCPSSEDTDSGPPRPRSRQ